MKKMISLLIGILMLSMTATTVMATHSYDNYDRYPRVNPSYGRYVDTNSYLREEKFRNAVERFRYQREMSPYVLVRSPYPANWDQLYKPYGDEPFRQRVQETNNPFYGFQYFRAPNCHGYQCHFHNIFPGSR